jgi:hypothetical protein
MARRGPGARHVRVEDIRVPSGQAALFRSRRDTEGDLAGWAYPAAAIKLTAKRRHKLS